MSAEMEAKLWTRIRKLEGALKQIELATENPVRFYYKAELQAAIAEVNLIARKALK